jgi:mitochondrial distribution and morphology protein 10
VAAISELPSSQKSAYTPRIGSTSNVIFYLQHDVGKWCTEYTWSAEDGMWGLKFLHNFGRLGHPPDPTVDHERARTKRVDEEEPIEGGLRGRLSAGAEFYFSAKERSAGGEFICLSPFQLKTGIILSVSTGIRFTTLPDATPPSFQLPPNASALSSNFISPKGPPSQPPTTITALYNPIIGHLSGAYTARVSQDLSLSSRFEFNVYSLTSEWAMGAEWWLRKPPANQGDQANDPHGVVKARASTSNVSSREVQWYNDYFMILSSRMYH